MAGSGSRNSSETDITLDSSKNKFTGQFLNPDITLQLNFNHKILPGKFAETLPEVGITSCRLAGAFRVRLILWGLGEEIV